MAIYKTSDAVKRSFQCANCHHVIEYEETSEQERNDEPIVCADCFDKLAHSPRQDPDLKSEKRAAMLERLYRERERWQLVVQEAQDQLTRVKLGIARLEIEEEGRHAN